MNIHLTIEVLCGGCSPDYQKKHCIKCPKCGSFHCWHGGVGSGCNHCHDSSD